MAAETGGSNTVHSCSTSVWCRFEEDCVRFTSASKAEDRIIIVDENKANRSGILRDLRLHTGLNVDVPLALSVQELLAWHTCVTYLPDSQAPEEANPSQLASLDDSDILQGLVVRSQLVIRWLLHFVVHSATILLQQRAYQIQTIVHELRCSHSCTLASSAALEYIHDDQFSR